MTQKCTLAVTETLMLKTPVMGLNKTDERHMNKGNIYKLIYSFIEYITLNLQE